MKIIKNFSLIKFALIILSLAIFFNCETDSPKGYSEHSNPDYHRYDYNTIVIDNCEYIVYTNNGICHKGNCKFCEKRKNK